MYSKQYNLDARTVRVRHDESGYHQDRVPVEESTTTKAQSTQEVVVILLQV